MLFTSFIRVEHGSFRLFPEIPCDLTPFLFGLSACQWHFRPNRFHSIHCTNIHSFQSNIYESNDKLIRLYLLYIVSYRYTTYIRPSFSWMLGSTLYLSNTEHTSYNPHADKLPLSLPRLSRISRCFSLVREELTHTHTICVQLKNHGNNTWINKWLDDWEIILLCILFGLMGL